MVCEGLKEVSVVHEGVKEDTSDGNMEDWSGCVCVVTLQNKVIG